MIKEAFGTASTQAEAYKKAIAALNAPLEAEVKFEIIAEPKKKVLGLFGGSDAKVRVYYDDGKPDPAAAQKEAKPEKKPEVKKEIPANKKAENVKAEKETAKKEAPAKENRKKPAEKVEAEAKKNEIDIMSIAPVKNDATEYLRSIIVKMGFADADVVARETEEDIYFEITCSEDYGNIIGRRGETLDALQYLVRLFVNRTCDNEKRVSLNVGDYRSRREETLKALAKRQAARVVKYGRNVALEPMNPYERRLIHTAVQGIDGVSSHSIGEGDRRRVIITPVDGERRGNYHRDRRSGDRREKRAPYIPETKEGREQKVDAVASSRYGKIEPKKNREPAEE